MLLETNEIHVNSSSLVIIYQYNVLYTITGFTTTLYSGASLNIVSGITISSGFTFNLHDYPYNIDRLTIIDNLIDYIYDNNYDLNKYMLNILIVDENSIYNQVSQSAQYCIKIYWTDNFGCTIYEYLIMFVINELPEDNDNIYYITPIPINEEIIDKCIKSTEIYIDPNPIIYYQNVYNLTGYTTNMFTGSTHLINTGITIESGFTLNLYDFQYSNINRLDIIDKVVYEINIDKSIYTIDVLIVDESIVYTEISEIGIYCIKLILINNIGCIIENYFILSVIYEEPIIDNNIYIIIENTTTTTTKSCIDSHQFPEDIHLENVGGQNQPKH